MKGEIGNREGAPVVMQGGVEPTVVEHDADGTALTTKKPKGEVDKRARKQAKKARNKAERQKGNADAAGEEG